MTSSQMLSCETCEVLKKISFKENCWSTAFEEHFGHIAFFISKKSTNCLGLPETAVHKRLTVFALEIFKDNQNIAKVESNILLMRSTQQRKWIVFSRSSRHPNVLRKTEFWNIRQFHWKISLVESFFRLLVCDFGKKDMNKPFSVNGCKHLWTSASESYLRMSIILFVLVYIRHKGRVKRFKGVPLIATSSEPLIATSNASFSWHFLQFFVLLKMKS